MGPTSANLHKSGSGHLTGRRSRTRNRPQKGARTEWAFNPRWRNWYAAIILAHHMLYLVRNSSFVPQMEQALLICTFPAAWTSFPNTGAGEFINIQFFPEAAGQNVLRPFQFVE